MRNRFMRLSVLTAGFLAGLAALAGGSGSASAATTSCIDGRCSSGHAALVLNGKDPLRSSIDTGWMPSCDDPAKEHCNKGIQVRANIALTAVAATDDLFTASLGQSATVEAFWPNSTRLELRTSSSGSFDSTLTVKHALTPQVELYLDVGPIEQGWTFPPTKLLQLLPGSKFNYSATGTAQFNGWAFDKANVIVPAPPLQDSQLFSVQLEKLSDVIGKITNGTLSLHAQASPTVSYRTTKVVVNGVEVRNDSITQMAFPPGNFDALDLPATIEGELTASGDIDVLPAATLSNLGDMNFNPPMTITFSSVKIRKHFESETKKYVFENKTIHIPLPNIGKFLHETDGGYVAVGTEGTVNALATNTGESTLVITKIESSDPEHFVVANQSIEIAPKSNRALNVKFRPDGLGAKEATITLHTNDPDTPELTFQVKANGTPGLDKDGKSPGEVEGVSEDGCGCRTAGSSSSSNNYAAALGGLALAFGAIARRRRS